MDAKVFLIAYLIAYGLTFAWVSADPDCTRERFNFTTREIDEVKCDATDGAVLGIIAASVWPLYWLREGAIAIRGGRHD